jgi:hypothetical protein
VAPEASSNFDHLVSVLEARRRRQTTTIVTIRGISQRTFQRWATDGSLPRRHLAAACQLVRSLRLHLSERLRTEDGLFA